MWTKKIEIKDENHLKEVVRVLKSMGEKVETPSFKGVKVKSLWCGDYDYGWCYSEESIYSKVSSHYKDVPEFEIITNTSYELKEVPKIKITCKNCGKSVEYKVTERLFKDFVIFEGTIDFGDKVLSSTTHQHICKGCIKKLLNNEQDFQSVSKI